MNKDYLPAIVALIALAGNLLLAMYNFKKPKRDEIQKEYLLKVICPLHKLLHLELGKNAISLYAAINSIEKIESIIYENYINVPEIIFQKFIRLKIAVENDFEVSKKESDASYLLNAIDADFIYLRNQLGYSQKNLLKNIKRLDLRTIVKLSADFFHQIFGFGAILYSLWFIVNKINERATNFTRLTSDHSFLFEISPYALLLISLFFSISRLSKRRY